MSKRTLAIGFGLLLGFMGVSLYVLEYTKKLNKLQDAVEVQEEAEETDIETEGEELQPQTQTTSEAYTAKVFIFNPVTSIVFNEDHVILVEKTNENEWLSTPVFLYQFKDVSLLEDGAMQFKFALWKEDLRIVQVHGKMAETLWGYISSYWLKRSEKNER